MRDWAHVQRRFHDRPDNPKHRKRGGRRGLACATPSLPKKGLIDALGAAALSAQMRDRFLSGTKVTPSGQWGEGIRRDKGERNRLMREANAQLQVAKGKIAALKKSAAAKQIRVKKPGKLLRMADCYQSCKPAYLKMNDDNIDSIIKNIWNIITMLNMAVGLAKRQISEFIKQ